ncbi:calcium-binding protein [Salipiger abyssi]|uniref:calcium-binding protein n=1 Tax=Salipiger abyssi TaxID=1250539 RepID=UPI004057F386
MEVLLLLGLATFGIGFITPSDNDDDRDDVGSDNDDDTGGQPPTGDDTDETITGTDGDDTITGGPTDLMDFIVRAGAGNDLIEIEDEALYSGETQTDVRGESGDDTISAGSLARYFELDGGEDNDNIIVSGTAGTGLIDGGEGNDLIDIAHGYDTSVTGGDGNDTISFTPGGILVDGGDGDDLITTDGEFFGEASTIHGGDGDDTLASDALNTAVYGDAGNDVVMAFSQNWQGTAYYTSFDGGDGDDTIVIEENAITGGDPETGTFDGTYANTVNDIFGGAGSDTFQATVNEGMLSESEIPDYFIDNVLQEDGTLLLDVTRIADFEPGVDMVLIDGDPLDDGFTLSNARIEYTADAEGNAGSEVILRYESETDSARDVVITLDGATVTWDDIAFSGDQIPELAPIAA